MAQKGIKGERTKSGAYVSVEVPGDKTMMADSGKVAYIKYKGYLQSNGEMFETNIDSSKGETAGYPVVVGTHSVIQGWDEGLPYFGNGGKGKILIPAFLAYGPQGSQAIPPLSNLVFDIEVANVKIAPPADKNPTGQIPETR